MGDAFSVPFILSWLDVITTLTYRQVAGGGGVYFLQWLIGRVPSPPKGVPAFSGFMYVKGKGFH